MSQSDEADYREGVVLNKPVKEGRGSFINAGLPKDVQIDRHLDAGLRVTVKMKPSVDGMSTDTLATEQLSMLFSLCGLCRHNDDADCVIMEITGM